MKVGRAYHERSRVQTVLVVFALKILATKLRDSAIVPPKEEADDNIKDPSNDNLGPQRATPDIQGRDLQDPTGRVLDSVRDWCGHFIMDGNENTDADDREDHEDVATHAHNAQEDGGIHANLLHQLFLVRAHQREDP